MILSNETLTNIANALDERNTLLSMISDIVGSGKKYTIGDWAPISAMIQNGTARIKFPLGTQFVSTYTDTSGVKWEMPWDVVHYAEVETADGAKKNGMFLQCHYATIESIQFDAPEPNNPDDSIKRYGYNRWSQSAYRQWLNSEAGKGSWWSAQSDTDEAPAQLPNYNGFLRGVDSVFKSAITPIKVSTACNTVTDDGIIDVTVDKIFLPSIEQVYGSPQLAGVEGEFWGYWRAATGLEAPNNNANDGRIIYALNSKSTAQHCRLRSASRSNAYSAWYVFTTGYLTNYGNATTAYRCAPACVIC